jgi:type IV secretion system protein VirB6
MDEAIAREGCVMACPAVTTGQGFLLQTLSHLDCQAQVIGGYGFQSLASPGSSASLVLTALLTLFIALFGLRLLFGGHVGMHDAIGAVLKVGIVLTLAVSWPAYRTMAYDTVLHGPAEFAVAINGSRELAPGAGLAERLQRVDDGIVSLTTVGTGRQTGQLEVPGEARGSFQGIALQDESGFGWGRTIYLAATIGALAALRIAAALLLAIAPLVAALLLFDLTRGVFAGWLRGLALTALGSLGISLLFTVQLAVMEPWLADILYRRTQGYATPSAPTELLALALGFGIASLALLALLARVAFQNSWPISAWLRPIERETESGGSTERRMTFAHAGEVPPHSRALAVGEGVRTTMRFETSRFEQMERRHVTEAVSRGDNAGRYEPSATQERLGSSYRRTTGRATASHGRRDTDR